MVAPDIIDDFYHFSKENLFKLIMNSGTIGEIKTLKGKIVTINGGLVGSL